MPSAAHLAASTHVADGVDGTAVRDREAIGVPCGLSTEAIRAVPEQDGWEGRGWEGQSARPLSRSISITTAATAAAATAAATITITNTITITITITITTVAMPPHQHRDWNACAVLRLRPQPPAHVLARIEAMRRRLRPYLSCR